MAELRLRGRELRKGLSEKKRRLPSKGGGLLAGHSRDSRVSLGQLRPARDSTSHLMQPTRLYSGSRIIIKSLRGALECNRCGTSCGLQRPGNVRLVQ